MEDTTGYYTYPNLKMDWNVYTKFKPYILDNIEYDKLHRFLTLRSAEGIQNFKAIKGLGIEADEVDITTTMLQGYSLNVYFSIQLTTFEDATVVRYRNPSYTDYAAEHFDTEYFEIDYNTFYDILLQ